MSSIWNQGNLPYCGQCTAFINRRWRGWNRFRHGVLGGCHELDIWVYLLPDSSKTIIISFAFRLQKTHFFFLLIFRILQIHNKLCILRLWYQNTLIPRDYVTYNEWQSPNNGENKIFFFCAKEEFPLAKPFLVTFDWWAAICIIWLLVFYVWVQKMFHVFLHFNTSV